MKKNPLIGWRPFCALLLFGLTLQSATAAEAVTPIIERGDEWRYLDTGVTPPAVAGVASWKAATYNAEAAGSPWKVGRGLFGYGDIINYGTQLTAGNPATPNKKFITHYFWKSFQLPATAIYGTAANATYNGFLIKVLRDDAAAVYVNGTEVLLPGPKRDNLPDTGALTNTTTSINPLEGQSETRTVDFVELRKLLNPYPANNVIAVEVHQASDTTTDARFDLSLDLVSSEPCYGDSRAGAFATFSSSGRGVANGIIHERDPIEEPVGPDYSFEDQDIEMNWRATAIGDAVLFFGPSPTDFVTSANLPGNALGYWFGSPLTWQSEVIDLRSFKDVVVSANVLGVKKNSVNWGSGDRLEFTVSVSGDGLNFRDLPWQRISTTTGTATGTAWTDLVAENAVKQAIVPTTANNPLNTGAGNWRTRAFNDSAWPSGTKGVGYENNPSDPTNYTELIDTNLDFKSQLFGGSPKKSVVLIRCVFPAVKDLNTYTLMRLLMKFDDGFVAYLNDQEVARKFVATTVVPAVPTAALPTPTSLATQGNADANAVLAEEFILTTHRSKLSATEPNVLAIYALNDKADSSDMLALPVLQVGKPGGPPPISLTTITPTITEPPSDFEVSDFTTITSALSGANGTNLIPPGTQSMRLRIVGTMTAPLIDKAFYVDDIKISGTPVIPDSFDNFMAVESPTSTPDQRAGKADVDGDSVMNIHEYAFGTDPTEPALFSVVDGVSKPIQPEVYTDGEGYAYIRFRLPGGAAGNPGTGYQVLDLNIRPQISFGGFNENDWKDEVNAVAYFRQEGAFVENGDGTVTVTCRTLEREVRNNRSLYLRVRVGVRYPTFMNGIDTPCYQP